LSTSHPHQPDPYYRYMHAFVGHEGAAYRVRLQFDASCTLTNLRTRQTDELFLLAPCRGEYTIATENLFVIPSSECRVVFGRTHHVPIARRPYNEPEPVRRSTLSERYARYDLQIRTIDGARALTTPDQVIEATLADRTMNARTTYVDERRGVMVTLEFPVGLINLQKREHLFQVCTGPVAIPDLPTWDGVSVDRMFLAEVAFSGFDYVEFCLRRELEAHAREREWLDRVRGRDRLELWDPNKRPPGYPPPRPKPAVYHQVLPREATTVILSAEAPA
ncbi:MAG: hypothetical protein FJ029_14750, partial [Actinobacteria bacterium]|nr:hypothetical protein [Actinomycetota bacterium]